jgi:dienelactone hydrolase
VPSTAAPAHGAIESVVGVHEGVAPPYFGQTGVYVYVAEITHVTKREQTRGYTWKYTKRILELPRGDVTLTFPVRKGELAPNVNPPTKAIWHPISRALTAAKPPPSTGPPRLAFDQGSTSLGYVDKGIVHRDGSVAIHDISYLSRGRRIAGYLAERDGQSKRPGIILVPGSGGTRSELLGDAVALASRGAVALTITTPSTAYPLPAATTADQLLGESREVVVADVVAVRRAADMLQTLREVDPNRIGYLGWSAGAKTGAYVAASDSRFRAFALLSGGADTLASFVKAAPPDIRAKARTVLGSVDPLRYLGFAKPQTVLLEDGREDEIVPREALENFISAAPRGTVVRWYPTGHTLNATAFSDAFTWLLRKLAAT